MPFRKVVLDGTDGILLFEKVSFQWSVAGPCNQHVMPLLIALDKGEHTRKKLHQTIWACVDLSCLAATLKHAYLKALVIAGLHLQGKRRIHLQPTLDLNPLAFLALWGNMKSGENAGPCLSGRRLRGRFLIFECHRRFHSPWLPPSLT